MEMEDRRWKVKMEGENEYEDDDKRGMMEMKMKTKTKTRVMMLPTESVLLTLSKINKKEHINTTDTSLTCVNRYFYSQVSTTFKFPTLFLFRTICKQGKQIITAIYICTKWFKNGKTYSNSSNIFLNPIVLVATGEKGNEIIIQIKKW